MGWALPWLLLITTTTGGPTVFVLVPTQRSIIFWVLFCAGSFLFFACLVCLVTPTHTPNLQLEKSCSFFLVRNEINS